jgi:hypothetical protein
MYLLAYGSEKESCWIWIGWGGNKEKKSERCLNRIGIWIITKLLTYQALGRAHFCHIEAVLLLLSQLTSLG